MNYKKLIVDSGKRMAGSGLTVETWGNISVRDSETGLVYLTPSAMLYDTIVEDDVVVCTLDGKIVEGTRKPTIETEMHLSVYRNRAEVNAVIHTHPLYSMVYAAQGKDIPLRQLCKGAGRKGKFMSDSFSWSSMCRRKYGRRF